MKKSLIIGLALALGVCGQTRAQDNDQRCAKCAVVFDIDGTLTPSVLAIWQARPNAAQSVQAYYDHGVQVIYLSARARLFQRQVPHWLADNGFPQGEIQLTKTEADRQDEAAFKTRVLQGYLDDGWTFIAGYGDSSTDFEAYANVGLRPDQIYGLKRANAEACQPGVWGACLLGWDGQSDKITRDLAAFDIGQ